MAKSGKRERKRARQQRRAERRAAQRDQGARTASGGTPAPSAADPVRGGASSFIDPDLRWHMVRTAPRLGPLGRKFLDEALSKGEVRTFRPRASEVVVRRGRRVVRRIPLLVRTVIVGVRDEDHLRTVAALPGVSEIVSHPGTEGNARGNVAGSVMRPARLDPEALQEFMIQLAANEIVRPVGIAVDDHVVIREGPFATFPGVVEQILPDDRVKVSVSIFGRTSSIDHGNESRLTAWFDDCCEEVG